MADAFMEISFHDAAKPPTTAAAAMMIVGRRN